MTTSVRDNPWSPATRRAAGQTRPSRPSRITRERAAALWAQADQAAGEAIGSGVPVALPAMTAADRRIVHDRLLVRIDVRVHAEGEDPERHLVVVPCGRP